MSNEITVGNSKDLKFKTFKVSRIENKDPYLLFVLDNDQKILTNGKEVYDFSLFDHFVEVLDMNGKKYAVALKHMIRSVVDLETMEIIFEDIKAYHISKQDDQTLWVLMHNADKKIYNIESRKYLPNPDDYEFVNSLGNGLYVFCEKDLNVDLYEQKHCIMNSNSEILLTGIKGTVYYSDGYLIVRKRDEISVINMKEKYNHSVNVVKKGETIIARPQYYKGNLIVAQKNLIKIIKPSLEVLKEINIDNLNEVKDITWEGDVLFISIPNGGEKFRTIAINLLNYKVIEHDIIEWYPSFNPKHFVGYSIDPSNINEYYFYDSNFNFGTSVRANFYDSIDSEEDDKFFFELKENNESKNILYNASLNILKEVPYDKVEYRLNSKYGFGANYKRKTVDFIDDKMNVVFKDISYDKFKFNFGMGSFSYFVVNGYLSICIPNDDNERTIYREIIFNPNGDVVLDSTRDSVYKLGNFIQIWSNDQSRFLNTDTGEISILELQAPVKKNGDIDLTNLDNFSNLLVGSNVQLLESGKSNVLEKKYNKNDLV